MPERVEVFLRWGLACSSVSGNLPALMVEWSENEASAGQRQCKDISQGRIHHNGGETNGLARGLSLWGGWRKARPIMG